LLVDLVAYSGESEMLQARLEHMNADLTVVYESRRSFTGFDKAVSDLSGLEDVLHYVSDGGVESDPWANEFLLRREAFEYVLGLGLPGDAIVAVCDVDEFPDLALLRPDLSVWNMSKFQMSARWFQKPELASQSGELKSFVGRDVVEVKRNRGRLPVIDGGWHLSSFFDLEGLLVKWRNTPHQECVRENMDEWVARCWVDGVAVEDGVALTEIDDLSGVPAAVLDGPEFWFRTRRVA
jgi:hypothetical protein